MLDPEAQADNPLVAAAERLLALTQRWEREAGAAPLTSPRSSVPHSLRTRGDLAIAPVDVIDEDAAVLVTTAERSVKCILCGCWIPGPTEWEQHRTGKKHKKNKRNAARRNAAPWWQSRLPPFRPGEASLQVQDLRGTSPEAPPGARWVPGHDVILGVRGVAGDTSDDDDDSDMPAHPELEQEPTGPPS